MILPQLIGGILQEKPKVPTFQKVSLADAQTQSTNANAAALPALKSLASNVNSFSQDQLLTSLRKVIPNYDQLVSKTRSIIDAELAGEIPQDVQDAISRNAAAKALGGGYGGSQMHGNLVARDLGLTSLNLKERGVDSASRWIQMSTQNLVPNLFDVRSMFITPTQQWAANVRDSEGQFNRDWVSNQLDAEFSLGTVAGHAIQKSDDQVMQIIASVAGAAASAYMNKK
jgi:hypothetical protein